MALTQDKNNASSKIETLQLIQNNYLIENENCLKLLKDNELKVESLCKKLEEEKQLINQKNQEIFTLKAYLREFEVKLHYITKEKEVINLSFF